MSKEEIFDKAKRSIVEADEDLAMEALREGEEAGISPMEMLGQGYSAGMKELGDLFGMGEVFLPELMFATEVMKTITAELEAKMPESETQAKGVMVIGTVAGDVHDIGKGIVASIVKTNGITVYDLGREVPAENFIAKVKEVNADFLGSSALLTTTMTEQKKIEELLAAEGLKGKVKTLVGGAPVTKRWAERIGADAYCEDATDTVNYILGWLGAK
jgi:trimethylamine corrinoid protein